MEELMKRIADLVPTLHGWCTVEKAQWLASRIVKQRYQDVAEIGVFGGRSLIPMALAMKFQYDARWAPAGIVDGIDPYSNDVAEADEDDNENRAWWKSIDLGVIRQAAMRAVKSQRVSAFVKFHACPSEQAIENYANFSLDMVHVDGSHNEKASVRDVNLWWPKLKDGGVMVMDDTDWKQLIAARSLVGSLGKIIHKNEKWEVYQKG
jgi:predicted O-methyltransferase YrrM